MKPAALRFDSDITHYICAFAAFRDCLSMKVKKRSKKGFAAKTAVIISVIIVLTAVCAPKLVNIFEKQTYPIKYESEVLSACERFTVDAALVYATIKVESDFKTNAVSIKGAVGLMQIMPATAKFIAEKLLVKEYDLFNPETNILFGAWYLKYLLNKFKSVSVAAAAYNAGEGNVSFWLKNPDYSPDGVILKDVPFAETAAYVRQIEKTIKKYKKLYRLVVDKSK